MKLIIRGDYARLSRERICAKHMDSGEWAKRGGETVILDRPGRWMLSQTDGFKRKETIYVELTEDGELAEAFGSRSKFSIVD